MSNLKALRARKAEIARACNQVVADAGDSTWTPAQQASYDNSIAELQRINAQIKAVEELQNDEADGFFADAAAVAKTVKGKTLSQADAARAAFALFLSHKPEQLSAEQIVQIKAAMSTTTGAEGGFTVPVTIAKELIETMKAFGGMREAADILTTTGGEDMLYPGSDGTAEVGEIVGQNIVATNGDITFFQVPLNTYMYSSKSIAIPWQLLADSNVDIVRLVLKRLAMRIGRIQNMHFTTGTGTAQPTGIVTAATSGRVCATGNTVTATYDDIVRLKHSVNRAYRTKAKFMMSDTALLMVSLIKDSQGRPIFVPGYETGSPGDVPDRLLNQPIIVNDDVAAPAANAKSMVYGDLSLYTIRDAAGSGQTRAFDDSAFALKGQRGFCGWLRSGGNLTDTAAVKFLQQSAT